MQKLRIEGERRLTRQNGVLTLEVLGSWLGPRFPRLDLD